MSTGFTCPAHSRGGAEASAAPGYPAGHLDLETGWLVKGNRSKALNQPKPGTGFAGAMRS